MDVRCPLRKYTLSTVNCQGLYFLVPFMLYLYYREIAGRYLLVRFVFQVSVVVFSRLAVGVASLSCQRLHSLNVLEIEQVCRKLSFFLSLQSDFPLLVHV